MHNDTSHAVSPPISLAFKMQMNKLQSSKNEKNTLMKRCQKFEKIFPRQGLPGEFSACGIYKAY